MAMNKVKEFFEYLQDWWKEVTLGARVCPILGIICGIAIFVLSYIGLSEKLEWYYSLLLSTFFAFLSGCASTIFLLLMLLVAYNAIDWLHDHF